MISEERLITDALNSLNEKFEPSELARPEMLNASSLSLVKSEPSLVGSFEKGDLVANHTICLRNSGGDLLCWTVEMNYSRFTKASRWNALWSREPTTSSHTALVYSYVKFTSSNRANWEEYIYTIESDELAFTLDQMLSHDELIMLSRTIVSLADACVHDLLYVLENNLFSKIVALANTSEVPLDASPFKE